MNDTEVKKIIFAVREEFGKLMRDIMYPLHECLGLSLVTNEDEANRRGKAMVALYKQLIAADIDKATAIQMVQKVFFDPVDLTNIVREYMLKNQEIAKELAFSVINSYTVKT